VTSARVGAERKAALPSIPAGASSGRIGPTSCCAQAGFTASQTPALEAAVERKRRLLSKGQDPGHEHSGDPLLRIDPVIGG
jgi:hypothetical protein